jgi:transposase InsO family protein
MAWDPLWDTAKHGSHTPGVGAGESRATAATRGVEGASAAAEADTDRPDLLGSAVKAVEELAVFAAGGAAGDPGRLAPPGIQTLLGVEEPTPMGSARDWERTAGSYSADEPRESALGRAEDPRRAVEAWPDGLAGSGFEVHAPAPAAAVAGVASVFKESRLGSDGLGLLHGADGDLRVLFVLVLLSHGRRRLVHFNVTEHPTAEWTARQLLEACGLEEEAAPRYLIRDRDQVYGERFSRQAKTLDIREAVIAPRSPWQNAYAERVIGSIRRECLDHVVVIGERHLLGILAKYVDYYNGTRTHLSLAKDAPESRSVQPQSQGRVVAMPRVGGLHHEYLRRAA